MPMYDKRCNSCERIQYDVYEPVESPLQSCGVCEGVMLRVWLPGTETHVIGDEIDVTIKHGLCNPDGTPRRYTSRAELRREEKRRGMVNHVTHVPKPGSDKSDHTTRWV